MKLWKILAAFGCGLLTSACAMYPTTVTLLPNAEQPPVPIKPDSQVVAEVQRHLRAMGYRPGPIDGITGRRTRAAVRAYQADENLAVDGQVSAALLTHLRATAPTINTVRRVNRAPSLRASAATQKNGLALAAAPCESPACRPGSPAPTTGTQALADISKGMTKPQVMHTWGKPDRVDHRNDAEATIEKWAYEEGPGFTQYVYFQNGRVIDVNTPVPGGR